MEFLKPYLQLASTLSNIPRQEEPVSNVPSTQSRQELNQETEDENIVSEKSLSGEIYSNAPVVAQVRNTSKRKRSTIEGNEGTDLGIQKVINYFREKNENKRSMTAIERTFMGWAKTVSTLSSKRQVLLKMKIGQLVANAEYEELDELEKRNTDNITNLSSRSNNMTQNEAFNTTSDYNTSSYCEQLYPSCSYASYGNVLETHDRSPSPQSHLSHCEEKDYQEEPVDFTKELPFNKY